MVKRQVMQELMQIPVSIRFMLEAGSRKQLTLFKILNASLSLNVMGGLVTVVVALPMSKKPLTLTVGVLSVRVPMAGPLLLGEILVSKFLRSYLLE